ncbi:O-acyltransferase WSD1-like [Dioscorea cayenensis subsp. rotundata]|uniref:diacylglycerol O-acyltransferase n=1 Tax=Dioscorea cayennensis subsp. rotundata TaxID=55577 RepID=A0AB40C694_DIOCR|nr:O-acyltransferase WSD1-like [Dioscorea cayenensis subsp. rotundata]
MADEEPVSPTGQYMSSSVLNVAFLVVFETLMPIHDSQAITALQSIFLPINPRFSSIMVRDEHGVQKWRKVEVKLEEHLKVPVFPQGLEQYDECLQDYMSSISMEPLTFSKPLWDLSIIKYPTSSAAGTFVFRLHHALGDGYSLMAALFACLKRTDDPSLPLTFLLLLRRKGCHQEEDGGVYFMSF